MDIVIVTYNRQRYLAKCLESVLAATDDGDRILVVDNASTDGTAEFLEKFRWPGPERFGVIRAARNRACAGGRNEGFAAFDDLYRKSPEILMLDDDIWLRPGWRAALRVLDTDINIGVVQLYHDMRRSHVIRKHEDDDLVWFEKTSTNTSAAIIRRAAFAAVGGYHESGRAMDWISTRFCKDVRKAGWRICAIGAPKFAEDMDRTGHPMNEREFYEATGYAEMRRQGKKRKVQLGQEGEYFLKGDQTREAAETRANYGADGETA